VLALLADIRPTGPMGFFSPANEAVVIGFVAAGIVLLALFVTWRLKGKQPPPEEESDLG